jgi:hypothetical protein
MINGAVTLAGGLGLPVKFAPLPPVAPPITLKFGHPVNGHAPRSRGRTCGD